jgi:hypothetical protein
MDCPAGLLESRELAIVVSAIAVSASAVKNR